MAVRYRIRTEEARRLVARLQLPEFAGKFAYGILFRDPDALLAKAGWDRSCMPPVKVKQDGYGLLFVGAASKGLQERVSHHFLHDCRMSSLRLTLACLLEHELDLKPLHIGFDNLCSLGATEGTLSQWMMSNARIAFHPSDSPKGLEKRLIERLAPPLNIKHQRKNPFAKHLMALRSAFVTRRSTPWVPAGGVRRAAYEKSTGLHLKRSGDAADEIESGVSVPPFDAAQMTQIDFGGLGKVNLVTILALFGLRVSPPQLSVPNSQSQSCPRRRAQRQLS